MYYATLKWEKWTPYFKWAILIGSVTTLFLPKTEQEKLEESAAKKNVRRQKAEFNRCERPLCEDWKAGRPWLAFHLIREHLRTHETFTVDQTLRFFCVITISSP